MSGGDLDAATEALWLLARLVPDRGVANVAAAVDVDRPVRWWPLREALALLVRRHPALREALVVHNGRPRRRGHDIVDVEPDLFACSPDDLDSALRRYAARPFDPATPPLLRVGAFAVGPERHTICLVAAHLVIDMPTRNLLLEELCTAYAAFAEHGSPPDLPAVAPPPPPAPEPPPETLRYWRARIADYDPGGMRLDGMRTIPGEPTFAGEQLERHLGERATTALAVLRRDSRGTDATVLLACFHAVLRRHGAAPDQVVGVMVDGRGGHRHAVGYRVATMPIRVHVDAERSLTELARQVSTVVRDGIDHPGVPFEVLARESEPDPDEPSWWRSRLVRHLFNYRRAARIEMPLGDGSVSREVCTGLSRFDTELTADRVGTGTLLKLLYSTEAYDAALATRLLARIERILCQAGEQPTRPIADLDLETDDDARTVARTNDTGVCWSGPPSVPGLVVRAARADPDAVAIVDGNDRFSYRQFLTAAASVRKSVHGHGPVVALAGPRGAGLAAAALGVWAAGYGYLPLDPDHPADRLAYLLDDAGCHVVVGGEHLPEEVGAGLIRLPLPSIGAGSPVAGDLPVLDTPTGDHLAYLIYTSGTTGRPKGVRLSHANLANVVRHFGHEFATGPDCAVGWLTTFAFDISALELWLPLAHGGRAVALPDAARTDGSLLMDLVREHDVSVVQATPTTWRVVAPAAAGRLCGRTVLCGGEPLAPALARDLRATGARVLNVYGPTETTIWSTVADVDPDRDPVPVGTPIANTRVYVLDARGRPQPVGLSGELAIGGAGVAPGYHDRPALTAERFVTDPRHGRLYRTGDRARILPDGAVALLGRDDRQVKLRAHRIELAEVERVLEDHPLVRAAAVVVRGDPTADGFLAAFVIAPAEQGTATELWSHAARLLPGYSVPARITVLPDLPRNGSGKVDTSTLENWPLAGTGGAPEPAGADPREEQLVGLWREILGRPHLGRDANFFLSGGHSMLAVRLAEEATARCAVPVRLGMVFRAPTPAALARLIDDAERAAVP